MAEIFVLEPRGADFSIGVLQMSERGACAEADRIFTLLEMRSCQKAVSVERMVD